MLLPQDLHQHSDLPSMVELQVRHMVGKLEGMEVAAEEALAALAEVMALMVHRLLLLEEMDKEQLHVNLGTSMVTYIAAVVAVAEEASQQVEPEVVDMEAMEMQKTDQHQAPKTREAVEEETMMDFTLPEAAELL